METEKINLTDLSAEIDRAREEVKDRVKIFRFKLDSSYMQKKELFAALNAIPSDGIVYHIRANQPLRTVDFYVRSIEFEKVEFDKECPVAELRCRRFESGEIECRIV